MNGAELVFIVLVFREGAPLSPTWGRTGEKATKKTPKTGLWTLCHTDLATVVIYIVFVVVNLVDLFHPIVRGGSATIGCMRGGVGR